MNLDRISQLAAPLSLMLLLIVDVAGCVGHSDVYEDPTLSSGDPDPTDKTRGTFNLPLDAQVEVCNVQNGLNNRSGPGTEYMILRVLQAGTRGFIRDRAMDWYKLDLFGAEGWSHGSYLCLVQQSEPPPGYNPGPEPGPGGPPPAGSSQTFNVSQDGIINVAKAYVGYSYWLGGGRFPDPWDDPGSKDKGKCYSSTSSGHAGHYGADCSGYAAKVWQLPEALPFTSNKHPFTTQSYYSGSTHWSHISRQDARRADMLVYRSGGAGHSMIYEGGDPWGQAWTYEARGCSWGVVHNLRAVSSKYQARRRHGI